MTNDAFVPRGEVFGIAVGTAGGHQEPYRIIIPLDELARLEALVQRIRVQGGQIIYDLAVDEEIRNTIDCLAEIREYVPKPSQMKLEL